MYLGLVGFVAFKLMALEILFTELPVLVQDKVLLLSCFQLKEGWVRLM